ncbi:MAG: hypothetical protein WC135_02775 [Bacteroidales bacterium]
MKRQINLLRFYGVAILILVVASCGSKDGDVFDQSGFNAFDGCVNKRVEAYFDFNRFHNDQVADSSPKVYIDFSDGMVHAYTSNPDNAKIIEKITQKLTGSDILWFGLGRGVIYPLDFPTTQLYNKVTDTRSYAKEIMAPIEGAVKDITSSNSDALLVTDFEEYTPDRKEQFENFAKGYFIDWLSKGNSIDFFITDYTEKTNDRRTITKHLYFIVFNAGPEKKMLTDINYALKDRGYKYETFSLSTTFYTLSNEYEAVKRGGNYYDKNGNDIVGSLDAETYINGLTKNNKPFEFYNFQQPWKDIIINSKSLMEAGVPNPFTDFFRKLYLDASNDDVFLLKGLDVKVYDVTEDFVFHAKTNEVNAHKPKLSKDASGNSIIADDETDVISLTCFNGEGNIKNEWKYSPKDYLALNEVFVLNKELYNNGYKQNKNKIELGIKYHPNFSGSQISNPNGLLRVDIIIDECDVNFNRLDLFKWESLTVAGKQNESLAEAIRNTLDKVNPKGKVIYSYFIKTGEQ